MIDFHFFELFLNFLLLEFHRQYDIPLTGDIQDCYRFLHYSPFKVHY